jgi:heat shock protein HslJ
MNTNWRLMSYLDAHQTARVSSINTEKMTLQFGKDGMLSGNAGCNTYSAQYRINPKNNRIDLGNIISTQKYCAKPADLMKEEQAFLGDLQQVKSFKRSSQSLELFDAKGKRLLDFRQM